VSKFPTYIHSRVSKSTYIHSTTKYHKYILTQRRVVERVGHFGARIGCQNPLHVNVCMVLCGRMYICRGHFIGWLRLVGSFKL